MKSELTSKFFDTYGQQPAATYFTPGRVNLIGEHIDYNGGLVVPCAITLGTWLSIAPNNDKVIRFKSLNFPEEAKISLQPSYVKDGNTWVNYPLGVINEILKNFQLPVGFDLLYSGNIPVGSGLSSSASIEVVTAYALTAFLELDYTRLALVQLAKKVENEFIGVNSGIMDQFAVTFGEKDKAIVLNCDTLEYQLIDCNLGDHVLTIINTNKPRELAESKYNERVAECQSALAALNTELNLSNLCELDAVQFAPYSHLIKDETVLRRAIHVIQENDRVHLASKALTEGKLEEFGKLMYASHQSLKELYEVTGKELDTVVDFCATYPAVTGARMTGAGFGGCAIAILKKGAEQDFTEKLTEYYQKHIGYAPNVYISEIGSGATTI